jgi:hypothetical protein
MSVRDRVGTWLAVRHCSFFEIQMDLFVGISSQLIMKQLGIAFENSTKIVLLCLIKVSTGSYYLVDVRGLILGDINIIGVCGINIIINDLIITMVREKLVIKGIIIVREMCSVTSRVGIIIFEIGFQ